MKAITDYKVFIYILLIIGLSACSPTFIPSTGGEQGSYATQESALLEFVRATATVSAMQTEISQLQTAVVVANTNTPEAPTALPTETPLPTETLFPTATATALPPTAVPTATHTPLPTATAIPCNLAQFVEDVTVPDGTVVTAGTSFTKIWRLRNNGACSWTVNYDLVFYDGDPMDAPAVVPFGWQVDPGQTVDLAINLIAPATVDRYRGYWMLRDSAGNLFGVGQENRRIYVDIRVAAPENRNPLDFAENYCLADWSSSAGRVPCLGQSGDDRGYVRRIDKPTLESGYIDDEPALLTVPQNVYDGAIRGKYPELRIENGWHFTSLIGCANKASNCDVNFRLEYQIGNGAIQTLGTWREVYDEQFQTIDVDLSSLAGKDVKLILTVLANGSPSQDQGQWLAPRIYNAIQWHKP